MNSASNLDVPIKLRKMILEDEEDSRDFTTIYKQDYLGKKSARATKYKPHLSYQPPLNILNGSYKQYLNTRQENHLLPENERSEDPRDNLNRLRDKFPHLRKHLPEIVPDENVIEREKKNSRKTLYQLDYSIEFGECRRLNHLDVTLPQNWYIPETVQRYNYRNPWLTVTKDFIKSKMFKPCTNLDPNPKEREILGVRTGNSEYLRTIGITGEKIMLKNLSNTECIKLQKSLQGAEITDSKCSLIMKHNLVFPSNIF